MYEKLDKLIVEVIANRESPIYNKFVIEEAARIAKATGRIDFRVIDGRLQALRKAKKICYLTKSKSNGQWGWRLA